MKEDIIIAFEVPFLVCLNYTNKNFKCQIVHLDGFEPPTSCM